MLDTNVFMHFQTFDEVEWNTIAGAPEVCLLLTSVVLRELDKFKNDPVSEWRRQRARTILGKLEALLLSGAPSGRAQVRNGVVLSAYMQEPATDWAALGLDPQIADDRLIASILAFGQATPQAQMRLVSNDLGLRLKADHHGIMAIDPASSVRRLDSATEESRRNAQLTRQVAELERQVQESALQRALTFQDERLTALASGNGWVPLVGIAMFVMHLIPLHALDTPSTMRIDLANLDFRGATVAPSQAAMGLSVQPNFQGTAIVEWHALPGVADTQCKAYGYAQFYRTGIIEIVNADIIRDETLAGVPIIRATVIEEEGIYLLPRMLQNLQTIGATPPILVAVSLVGVRGRTIPRKEYLAGLKPGSLIGDDILRLPEVTLDALTGDAATLLKPAFDVLWNACGHAGSPNYAEDGSWAPRV
ncbi:MAG TPA: PIN domain-containing protein [Ktedonobacterales bacterium]